MSSRSFERWRLTARVAPFVIVVAALKTGLAVQGWEPVPLSPLYTGLLAATVFLLGFLLAGTLADYKESEKLPGDLAASLETIADECQILYADKRAEPAIKCLGDLRDLVATVLEWLHRRRATDEAFAGVSRLNESFHAFEPLTQPNFIVRLKQEQTAVRRMLIRVDTIRETSFVGAAYAVAELATFLLVIGLLLAEITPAALSVFIVSSISFLLVYMIFLIRDLDDPFEFATDGSRAGAAEVSLLPLERLERRLSRELEVLSAGEGVRVGDEPGLELSERLTRSTNRTD